MKMYPAIRSACLVAGGIALCVAFGLGVRRVVFLRSAQSVESVVVSMVYANYEGGETRYGPQFEFISKDGKRIVITPFEPAERPEYQMGQKALVLYDPRNPSEAFLDSFWELWGVSIGFAAPAAVLLFFGCLIHFSLPSKYRLTSR